MKNPLILGVSLILFGVCLLGYRQFNYRTRETLLEVGPLKATAETTKSVPISPLLGWALVASGAGVLLFAKRSKT
jgi:hypothetical protein